jgi:hypothetical protein
LAIPLALQLPPTRFPLVDLNPEKPITLAIASSNSLGDTKRKEYKHVTMGHNTLSYENQHTLLNINCFFTCLLQCSKVFFCNITLFMHWQIILQYLFGTFLAIYFLTFWYLNIVVMLHVHVPGIQKMSHCK